MKQRPCSTASNLAQGGQTRGSAAAMVALGTGRVGYSFALPPIMSGLLVLFVGFVATCLMVQNQGRSRMVLPTPGSAVQAAVRRINPFPARLQVEQSRKGECELQWTQATEDLLIHKIQQLQHPSSCEGRRKLIVEMDVSGMHCHCAQQLRLFLWARIVPLCSEAVLDAHPLTANPLCPQVFSGISSPLYARWLWASS